MIRQVFNLPDLGEGLTEAELVRWLVKVGDTIAIDDPVAEVETAKAVVEVPSPYGGVIANLHGDEGTTIPVGSALISVDDNTTETIAAASGAPPEATLSDVAPAVAESVAETYREEERAGSGNVLIGYGTPARPSTGTRRRRRQLVTTQPASNGATPLAKSAKPAVASPIVRKLARELQIDITTISGTGPNGIITRGDVAQAASNGSATSVQQQRNWASTATDSPEIRAGGSAGQPATDTDQLMDSRTTLAIRETIPLKGIRKAIATALTRSRAEIPEATTWVDVDATDLLDLRSTLSSPDRRAPSLLALLARFTVAGLRRFPELNARIDLDRQEIVHLDGVNLGIAAQTDRGLIVPAVRDAHRRSARELDAEIRRVVESARSGKLPLSEMSCGSFTLNNYGVLGVDGSAAIINHPEVAILGVGRVLGRPWVVAGQIEVRNILQLSLAFDHRVCDGGTAAGFLRFVADAIESPSAALFDV